MKAEIAEVERKPGYGRFSVPMYIFTLNYRVGEEWLQANVKVTKEVFDKYREGSSLIINFKQTNPYYVFLPSELTFNLSAFFIPDEQLHCLSHESCFRSFR